MKCLNCQTETSNPKFCSRSCAATYTNKISPKRKLERTCTHCSSIVKSWRHTLCSQHWESYKENQYRDKTIGEYRSKQSVKGKHPSWINSHIRLFARSWFKELQSQPCAHCGYTKHVEIAHVKAVCDFPDTALLSEVNSRDNLIPLCPNCHWEFDNLPRS